MSNFTFTAESITVAGKTFPAEYSITPTGAVMAFVTVPGAAEIQRVRFPAGHPDHAAALAAAKAERAQRNAAQDNAGETVTTDPVPALVPQPAAETVQQAETEQPAQGPAKDFIGQTITGHGWRIFFDGEAARTRVIFDAAPTAGALAALEKAGFYFSRNMNSYNKKLTCKAHRAALALSGELSALYA